MTLTGHIAKLRTRWATRFTDEVTMTVDTEDTFDPDTLTRTPVADTAVYTGSALIRPATATVVRELFGDQSNTIGQILIYLPHTATGIRAGHLVIVTTSTDPELALSGSTARVLATSRDTHITRRAVLCRLNHSGG